MISFLTQNLGTIVVLAGLSAVVVLIVLQMKKDKKAGKSCSGCGSGCNGGCSGCSCSTNKK